MQSDLFSPEQVNLTKLRSRAYMRWNVFPPDVIPLTAADPDFPVAWEISNEPFSKGLDRIEYALDKL